MTHLLIDVLSERTSKLSLLTSRTLYKAQTPLKGKKFLTNREHVYNDVCR
jgi:hypothetical protein